jgi:phospholipase/carboxylesterase
VTATLDTLDIETAANPVATILWMHGLGADAHDFEPIVPELARLTSLPLRFVFPNAPVRPVTVNGGYPMRAWFDISVLGGSTVAPDEPGIRQSAAAIRDLIRRENEHGIATNRIVLGGFSQGAGMAAFSGLRHPGRLAGIVALSGFPLLVDTLEAEAQPSNRDTPVFVGHGTYDPMVHLSLGEALARMLETRGNPIAWHTYPIEHGVSPEEIVDVGAWLRRVLPNAR